MDAQASIPADGSRRSAPALVFVRHQRPSVSDGPFAEPDQYEAPAGLNCVKNDEAVWAETI